MGEWKNKQVVRGGRDKKITVVVRRGRDWKNKEVVSVGKDRRTRWW